MHGNRVLRAFSYALMQDVSLIHLSPEVWFQYYQEIQKVRDDVNSGGDFELSLKIHMHKKIAITCRSAFLRC